MTPGWLETPDTPISPISTHLDRVVRHDGPPRDHAKPGGATAGLDRSAKQEAAPGAVGLLSRGVHFSVWPTDPAREADGSAAGPAGCASCSPLQFPAGRALVR